MGRKSLINRTIYIHTAKVCGETEVAIENKFWTVDHRSRTRAIIGNWLAKRGLRISASPA